MSNDVAVPESELEARPCKGCGKKLYFVRDVDGKLHPLDASAPVYSVRRDLSGAPIAVRVGRIAFVTHFATCAKADDFSASKKGAQS